MNKIEETSSAHYDENIDAVIGKYVGFLTPLEFISVANKQLHIIKTRNLIKQLNDVKKMKVLKPEIQEYLNNEWFPKAQKAGLKYLAFVVPDDVFGNVSMNTVNRNANEFGIEIQYFNNMDNAKNWLISKN